MATTPHTSGPQPSSIFVSYSRVDLAWVHGLVGELAAVGIDVWLDVHRLKPGAAWDSEIERALQGTSVLMIVLSPDSVKSRNVLDEVNYALNKNLLVVPVLYRPCEVPYRIARLQHVDFTKGHEAAFAQLTERLRFAATITQSTGEDDPHHRTQRHELPEWFLEQQGAQVPLSVPKATTPGPSPPAAPKPAPPAATPRPQAPAPSQVSPGQSAVSTPTPVATGGAGRRNAITAAVLGLVVVVAAVGFWVTRAGRPTTPPGETPAAATAAPESPSRTPGAASQPEVSPSQTPAAGTASPPAPAETRAPAQGPTRNAPTASPTGARATTAVPPTSTAQGPAPAAAQQAPQKPAAPEQAQATTSTSPAPITPALPSSSPKLVSPPMPATSPKVAVTPGPSEGAGTPSTAGGGAPLTPAAAASTPAKDEEPAVRQAIAQYAKALNDRNVDLLIRIRPDLPRADAQALVKGLQEGHQVFLEDVHVTLEGAKATARLARRDVVRDASAPLRTRLAVTLARRDGGWVIQRIQKEP